MTKGGSNARKKAARELSAAGQITYIEGRVDARTTSGGRGEIWRPGRPGEHPGDPAGHDLNGRPIVTGGSTPWHSPGRAHPGHRSGDVTARLWDLATGKPPPS